METEFTLGAEGPFVSQPHPLSHPARLATAARLFGLAPTPVNRCRVLELGCALGNNLIPMAQSYPESTFLGIDESARAVAAGNQAIETLGLKNIALRQHAYSQLPENVGQFSYVIAHGIFSHRAEAKQNELLATCARALEPAGLAYLSYNVYPGWHLRGMVAEMLSHFVQRFADPGERVRQARGFAEFLAKTATPQDSSYQRVLREEAELLRQGPDWLLQYEYLQQVNHPVYFHAFDARASAHGLRYVADAQVSTMAPKAFDPEAEQALARLATKRVEMEQYLDYLRPRLFRHTILCREAQLPHYRLEAPVALEFSISSGCKPVSPVPNLALDIEESFRDRSGITLATSAPVVKAALLVAGENWPRAIPFRALLDAAIVRLGAKPDPANRESNGTPLALFLLECFTSSNLVELHLYPPAFVVEPSARPLATPLARWQATRGATVTTQRHEQVVLSEAERQTLRLLDGACDRTALVESLLALVERGILAPQKSGQKVTQPDEQRRIVEDTLNHILTQLGRSALLVA